MNLRADVYIDSPNVILGYTVRALPGVSFEVEHQATTDVFFVSARTDGDEEVFQEAECQLAEDPTVGDFRVSLAHAGRRVYALDLVLDRPTMSEVAADLDINLLSARSHSGDTGWTFEMEAPDRDAIVALQEFWSSRDVTFDLRRLFSAESAHSQGEFGLSTAQREALLLAFREGYFEVPRGISQQELADELGTSPTAVSQRLRRAVATLLAHTIAAQEKQKI